MAKTKHLKYKRVLSLPNVVFPDTTKRPWPWESPGAEGVEKILELGCGKGEHSLGFAKNDPDRIFIGVDLKSYRICTGAERGLDLSNLFFLRTRVEALDTFFSPGSIHEIWITFPDPHPKQREIKHRLTSPGFLALYARLLVPGGRVHLKTDSRLLFDYTRAVVDDWGGRVVCETPDLHQASGTAAGTVSSAFEARALSLGETVKYLSFTLN